MEALHDANNAGIHDDAAFLPFGREQHGPHPLLRRKVRQCRVRARCRLPRQMLHPSLAYTRTNSLQTYYTFDTEPKHFRSDASHGQFAHTTQGSKHDVLDKLIFYAAFDTFSSDGTRSASCSRLFASTEFCSSKRAVVDSA